MSASLQSNKPYADQALTGLAARWAMNPGTTRVIRLGFYCRSFRLTNNTSGGVAVIQVGFSRAGTVPPGDTACVQLFPGTPPIIERFEYDDEGPPLLYVHALATNIVPAACDFWYFPSVKRHSFAAPLAGGSEGYPEANVAGGTIIPGL